jgi:myosin heavy subunit
MLTIDGIDDTEEMKMTDEAMDVLGFTKVCRD